MKAAVGEEVNAKVRKEQHLAIESSQLHTLCQEHTAIKWVELAAATGDVAFKNRAIQFATVLFQEKMDEIRKKRKRVKPSRRRKFRSARRKSKWLLMLIMMMLLLTMTKL